MIFLTDEMFPARLARLLAVFDYGNSVESLAKKWGKGLPDEEWLRRAAQEEVKPVILSCDKGIWKDPAQRQVLKGCGLTYIYLAKGWGNLTWDVQALKIIKIWPAVRKTVARLKEPALFEMTVKGPDLRKKCLISEL